MTRRIRLVAALAGILAAQAATAPARAQLQAPTTKEAQEMRACEVLATTDSWNVRTALSNFQTDVLGRNTLDWKVSDFDRILNAAKSCDGYQSKANGRTVWNKDWEDQILTARNFVMPVIEGFNTAVKQASETPRDLFKVPACPKLLDWRFENKTFNSNARELFGANLFELSSRDLRAISRFTSDCANALSTYAIGRFQISQERTITIVSRIVQVVDTIAQAKEDAEKSPKHANDVVATIDNVEIPVGLAHDTMQSVVRRFNQLNIRGGGLSADAISELEHGVAAVLNRSDITSIDQAFADAIHARINSDIFSTR